MVGERTVAPSPNYVEQGCSTLSLERRANYIGDLVLAHANTHHSPGRLHRGICGQGIAFELVIFIGVLAHSQRTYCASRELACRVRQSVLHQGCKIRAHGFVQHDAFGTRGIRSLQKRSKRRVWPLIIRPNVKRKIRMLAGAFRLQRWHQKTCVAQRYT